MCEFDIKNEFDLLYRASPDGFSLEAFHSKCDNIPNTLTIIRVKDKPHIFGGYTEATWEGSVYKQDPNAFIFSLVNSDNKPIKMKISLNIQNAIFCYPVYGPRFGHYDIGYGKNFDIHINSYSNQVHSSTKLGLTYQHPFYQKDSNETKGFLAGSDSFLTSEIEVYQVLNNL
jgi:hypothetical protein